MDDKVKAFREELTARMIEALEKGTAPWQKPWNGLDAPRNAVTGRHYNGINFMNLGLKAFQLGGEADPRWCTFMQAKEKGWHVKKGAKGTQVVFWETRKKPEKDDNGQVIIGDDGEPITKSYAVGKVHTVFHASQIEGIPPYAAPEGNEFEKEEKAERIMADSGADIRYGGDRAFYNGTGDYIALPRREAFKSAADFYATALHELAHWTGHGTRLARKKGPTGTPDYAREELVAEMTALFLSAETGIAQTPEHFEQHAAYIDSWIWLLKRDSNALFKAASEASKAAEYLLKHERAREAQKDGEAAA